MADNRTMAQMLQAPIEGYEDAIVVPPINANNFELKQPLINLVQSNKFTGRQDPHNHLRFFNKVTSTFRHPEVPNTSIKLLLFPFSLDGEARDWLDKEPPRSILTWDDLVSKFINQFFPPSKTTYLRNKITTFYQEPNETFNEAWERFKELLRQCPHHGFSELHQLDTFYNSLNTNDQDALDSATGGNFLDKMPREGISPDVAALSTEVSELKNLMNTMLVDKQKYVSQAAASNFNQGNTNSRPPMVANQIRPPGFPPIQNNQNRFNPNQGNNFNQNRGTNFNQNRNFNQGQVYQPPTIQTPVYQTPPQQMQGVSKTDFENYVKANDAVLRIAKSRQGTLPSQTVTNPREHVNAITTRSGKTCEGPSTPLVPTPVVSIPSKEPEQNPETSMDKVQKPSLESTAQIPPPEEEESIFMKPKAKKTVNIEIQEPNSPKPTSYQPKLPYPERMKVRENDKPSAQHSRFLKMFKQLRLEIGLKDALVEMPKFNKWLSGQFNV
ncbi:reverse transcriptase domain-containing protein [Tanacetum coccineum]